MCALRLLLPVFYVLSSLPVQASFHYCLGRVKQISFYDANHPHCACPPDEAETSNCCNTEETVLDFQDEHTTVSQLDAPVVLVALVMPYPQEMAFTAALQGTNLAWRGPPQPPWQEGLYKKQRNFRL